MYRAKIITALALAPAQMSRARAEIVNQLVEAPGSLTEHCHTMYSCALSSDSCSYSLLLKNFLTPSDQTEVSRVREHFLWVYLIYQCQ